jgi:hypothetical protein
MTVKLKAIILENLPEGGLSVSAFSRLLRTRGVKLHRLELFGYLKALCDLGILRVRTDAPPCLIFSKIQNQPGETAAEHKDPVIP